MTDAKVAGRQVCKTSHTTNKRLAETLLARWETEILEGRSHLPASKPPLFVRQIIRMTHHESEPVLAVQRFSNTQVGSAPLGKFSTLLLFSKPCKSVDLIRSALKRLVLILQPLQFHDSSYHSGMCETPPQSRLAFRRAVKRRHVDLTGRRVLPSRRPFLHMLGLSPYRLICPRRLRDCSRHC
jgi:hypothetical protein